jgi:DNA-binding NarL/FixJ family response regulator
MQRRTVLIITSDELGWTDLRRALQAIDAVDIVGETNIAREAIQLAATHKPDLILSAASVEQMSAWSLLFDLQGNASSTSKIVVVASRTDPAAFAALDDLELAGYLLWSDLSTETVRHCLAAVLGGDLVVGSRRVAKEFMATQCRSPRSRPGAPPLTPRERATLRHLAEAHSHLEIATAEGISLRTVERILGSLQTRLNAPTAFVLGLKAAQLGLIP